jgi:hypothetical protein
MAHPVFVDDTNVITSSKHLDDDFCAMSNTVLFNMSKWFTDNKWAQNLDTTSILKFITSNWPQYTLTVG